MLNIPDINNLYPVRKKHYIYIKQLTTIYYSMINKIKMKFLEIIHANLKLSNDDDDV